MNPRASADLRVLVIGATGLLGSTLTQVLEAHRCHVIRHGRTSGEVRGDLSEPGAALAVLEKAQPQAVINLAALTNVDLCEQRPQQAYLGNTAVVQNLVAAIRRVRPETHLIHISTDHVYDGSGPHSEDDITLTNYYAFSKYAGELAAAQIPSTVLRTNFFGFSHKAGQASFSDWIVRALKSGEPVRVFKDVQFSPLSIDRLAESIRLVLQRPLPGVFNLGSRQGMSKADFCYAMAHILNLPATNMTRIDSGELALRTYRPKDMRMDCSRFERAFGVELPTLQAEIESMKRYYL